MSAYAQLGATGANRGTKYAWMGARAFNRLGYEGIETQAEIDLLTEFLASGLHDPDLARYVPGAVLSGSCFPNNDPAPRRELGCP